MAVYTEVSFAQAEAFVRALGRGGLGELQGIAAGIENTNYFVTTDDGQWVLTLFERLPHEQLPFYLGYMQHLARRGLPVPEPQADAQGRILHTLCGRPAALLTRLSGRHVEAPEATHLEQLGRMLARLHLAGADFAIQQPHLRGLDWWLATVPEVLPYLEPADARLLRDSWASATGRVGRGPALPRGVIHADLFRDNVLFDGQGSGDERLSGLFDFFFAGIDSYLFDLAVCLNDWCIDQASAGCSTRRPRS
jgi:homoserine kinase type II